MEVLRCLAVFSMLFGVAWCGALCAYAEEVQPLSSGASAILWDGASIRDVFVGPVGTGAWYPRLLKFSEGRWLCAYDTNAYSSHTEVWISQSLDGGATWTVLSKASFGVGKAANGQLVELPNGEILCAYRLVNEPDYSIKISRSTDRGATWQELTTVLHNNEGVWEPHILRIPNGQLLIFYAQEEGTDFQTVELQRSDDHGRIWHSRRTVAEGMGSRDGMPVPAVLRNGEIVVAIEGWVAPGNPQMGIWMVRSSDLGYTWSARQAVYSPPAGVMAGAPYLEVMPTGELVLSFQEDREGGGVEMKVLVSMDDGQTWTVQPKPFGGAISWWNALAGVNPNTLFAITSVGRRIRIVNGQLRGPGDMDDSGTVGMEDFRRWVQEWLNDCSVGNLWCFGADLDRSGMVDLFDLALLAWFWG
jgi:hypothetical protein